MSIYNEDISNRLNQKGVTETMNVFFLLIVPTAILLFAWNDFRKDSNEVLLLVLYGGCILLYLFISFIFKIGKNHEAEIVRLKKYNYLKGDEVPYSKYVDGDGVIKDSKAWRVLYDDAIKQYRYDSCYPNYGPIRIVATDLGKLLLMYFVPDTDKPISDWKYGYLKSNDDAVILHSVLEYFGEDGYQVAKDWLAANSYTDSV